MSVLRCAFIVIMFAFSLTPVCANIEADESGESAAAVAAVAFNANFSDVADYDHATAATTGVDEVLPEPSITTIEWTHSAIVDRPDDRYVLHWTPRARDIVFRVEVRTAGYVGFGLSRNGRMAGADIAIGWVDSNGQPHLQDRHGASAHSEPVLDKKQNYHLLSGFENETHTVLVFKRKYDTCDKHDTRITNDTWRVIYAYDERDPEFGPTGTIVLKAHGRRQRGAKSLLLTQHVIKPPSISESESKVNESNPIFAWDLLSNQVSLPEDDDTLYWCKLFKLPANIERKNHMIGFQPVIQPGNDVYMHHVLIYQCSSRTSGADDEEFERLAGTEGHLCYEPTIPSVLKLCDKLIVVWTIGSEGLFMPADMGYPLDRRTEGAFLMMEIHYDNAYLQDGVRDSSGIRLFYTPVLRPIDTGVLSIGIDPNWKHLIPPKQTATVSYGHCVSKCTEKAFPVDGISVFAAVLHSQSIGKKMQLRHVRGDTELPPITVDNNYDVEYQEYRFFKVPVKVLPGDHLIAECTYNSRGRDRMTQGGFTTREEMCLMYVHYYPLMDMSLCHSVPTLDAVHASIGIEEVYTDRIPPVIKSPVAFANRSLAEYIGKYDWTKNMQLFREVTRTGSFEVICRNHRQASLSESESYYYPNITTPHREPKGCVGGRHGATSQTEGGGNPTKKERGTSTLTTKIIRPVTSTPTSNTVSSDHRDETDDVGVEDNVPRKSTSRDSQHSTAASSRDMGTWTSRTVIATISCLSFTSLIMTC